MLEAPSTFIRRLIVPLIALLLVVFGSSLPASAAAPPETLEQAQRRYVEAKVRTWSQSVLQFRMIAGDGSAYTGTGVYVTDTAGGFYLMTADHVLRDLAGQLGKYLLLRPFNADPDEDSGWINIVDVAEAVRSFPQIDLAIFRLKGPLLGMIAAQVADAPSEVGDTVLAFGFGAEHGRVLVGQIKGAAANAPFVAAHLGARPGDSGGPVFDVRTGRLIGIISSDAQTDMTEGFSRQVGPDGKAVSKWRDNGEPLGADTLIVHLAAIVQK